MELRTCRREDLSKLRRLYISAFPVTERMPFLTLRRRVKKGIMEMYGIYENDEFSGLCVLTSYRDIVLLTFLAVIPEKRGCGLGGKAIELIHKKYEGKRIVLEIEEPDGPENDIRRRRKAFYLRNGLKETGIFVDIFKVPSELLVFDEYVSGQEYIDLYIHAIGKMLTKNIILK